MKRSRLIVLAVLAVGLVAAGVSGLHTAKAVTDSLLFQPGRGQARTPADLEVDFEEVWLTADDGTRLQAWWIPGTRAGVMVLFFHGNGGTMATRLSFLAGLHRLGVDILAAEYRGYGDSDGSPSEKGLYLDAAAALSEARRRAGDRPVVVWGHSLGGAVAIHVAASSDVGGLVAESTFTTLGDMAALSEIPLARHVVAYEFDSLAKISRVRAPILLIHGEADGLVPVEMSRRLAEAAFASVERYVVAGGQHDLAGVEAYWQRASWFLRQVASKGHGRHVSAGGGHDPVRGDTVKK